jgi:uncharacterized membrane protein YbhN (UPF0104 family)
MNAQAATRPASLQARLLRILGLVIAGTAVAICVRALVVEWPSVSAALRSADPWWIAGGALCAAVGMWLLALLWHQTLRVFASPVPLGSATAWFFAGELGKYLPGGIWPLVGRGELARRGGVRRSVGYSTTLLSAGLMCVGSAFACALFAPFLTGEGLQAGWELLVVLIVPVGVAVVHPAIFGRILGFVDHLSRGRIELVAPRWGQMISLIALAVPTWLLIGVATSSVTQGLGFEQQPGRVAFAAACAWIVGFLFIPVPAGAGVRELVFVLVSGLAGGPAVAVAAVCRIMFVAVDAIGGIASLLWIRFGRTAYSKESEFSTW